MTPPSAPISRAHRDAGIQHICHFYDSRQDLIDVLVPFFAEGLRQGDFCLWGAAAPLDPDDAMRELARAVPELDTYITKGQLQIFPVAQLYDSKFDPEGVYLMWLRMVKTAIANGFTGFRCNGNTRDVPTKDWLSFLIYESFVNAGVGEFPVLATCSYPKSRCNEDEIGSVRRTHQSALVKRGGAWEFVAPREPRYNW